MNSNDFYVGQTVLTNRVLGRTSFQDRAIVLAVEPTTLLIEYTAPGIHEFDFQTVRRTFSKVRAA